MAASLTKEQLKNELISHGISPPVQSARKEEFVKLYEQHVAPIVSQKGDFSSDDDEEPETKANGNQVCYLLLLFVGIGLLRVIFTF